MSAQITGRAWTFGDDIDTDVLSPGVYMKLPVAEAAKHCLEAVDPAFAPGVAAGDVVVGGANFGLGSSREQAPEGLKVLGVGAVLAKSFARIFYRNALNLGLPALFFPAADEISAGDRLEVDPLGGEVRNLTTAKTYAVEPIPPHLMRMIEDGGLMPHLEKRLAAQRAAQA
ncbi:MAG TPA: 3-isopropylmalate dehydratase [Caulobacteraceae bacterium]|jgi:3-isopropylmalate/(R)-2-methylmalate dehydratase small subunit|nr:3-isopropylmalate dehydratase [Caulobacteraceae bacterium]